MIDVLLFTFLLCVKVYLLLSLIYFVATFQENLHYVKFYAEGASFFEKAKLIASNMMVSLVFGGVILIQKIYKTATLSYKKFKAWYQLARAMRQITKSMKDVSKNEKGKS